MAADEASFSTENDSMSLGLRRSRGFDIAPPDPCATGTPSMTYKQVNMCKYVSYIIDTLNHDESISTLLNPVTRIHNLLDAQAKRVEEAKQKEEQA